MEKNLKSVGLGRKPKKFSHRNKIMSETARNCVVKLNRLTTQQLQQLMRDDHTNLTPDSKGLFIYRFKNFIESFPKKS